jgi:hypothetical protein
MRYNGKKFSDIILEQGSEDDLKPAEFMGKPVDGKFLGYNDQGEPEYELPEVPITAKAEKRKILFQISDNGEVTDVKFGI